jgi:beta-glucosidase
VAANDGARLLVDGKPVVEAWTSTNVLRAASGKVALEAGREHALRLEYFEDVRDAEVRLAWRLPGGGDPFEEALAVARAADVVVFVGGLTAEVEGEEMRVAYPGFQGGDRTDIALPAVQQKLLQALHGTGKPVVLVLTTGSALGVGWAKANLPAIVLAWYPGQRGGDALADVLFGDVSPAGRLPVTFYEKTSDLPPFADYAMSGRTYRYFRGQPLFPFGHGLSYTRFEYSGLRIEPRKLEPRDAALVSLEVRNTGTRDGDEVVQLYARDPRQPAHAPIRELRGFERVSLRAGESRRVSFTLVPERDLARYDEQRRRFLVEPGTFEVEAGASSSDLRLRGQLTVGPPGGGGSAAAR